ncbi:putative efflux transporter, RND family, membrane fusion protein subunit [Aurantimonas manganoxydans SI85-9A1]|uniref:Putative efflux transporter, RND family, membrane fusion protein subunit n=1 Tax=Aurantimonas manganoxydans (strain ATCC BAA-1229 / DSM 21871 / SI85-9A1) TaxID=287752 RepID=Q1YGV1_AURMS|nr:efflux RND transporter periplasmic adaptor subunit [Aurantimonas manganoxydans]EAS49124.1 putative efflux transporter, RND family, membrane fusion protein subunit [Aurantimonas manganoxydans SI85-9A1]
MTRTVFRRLLWSSGLVVAIAMGATTAAMNETGRATAGESAAPAAAAVKVSVQEVTPRSVTLWKEYSGRLEAVDRVEIRPRVGGAIQSFHFREGALVKAGDLIATIDQAPYQAAVARARADVEAAEAQVNLAALEVGRAKSLVTSRAVSQSTLDQRSSTLAQAVANADAAKAALRTAELDLGYTEVRSPIDGRIGQIKVTAGNLVAAGLSSAVLTTVVSVDPIYAGFDVNAGDVAEILSALPDQDGPLPAYGDIPVEVQRFDSEGAHSAVHGRVQLIGNEVDPQSGTLRIRAALDNPKGSLIPGEFVRIRLGQPRPQDRLLISERTVGTDQDRKYVLVVGEDRTVEYRTIRLGASVDGLRVVEDGLKPGEQIVAEGIQSLTPGTLVDPQPVTLASAE